MSVTQISKRPAKSSSSSSQELVRSQDARELVFAVVGHLGAGTSKIAKTLRKILERSGYDVSVIKARDVLGSWAKEQGQNIGPYHSQKSVEQVTQYQDLGDEMRREDRAAVAKGMIGEIRRTRAQKQGQTDLPVSDEVVTPDGTRRAYILDSIRHPDEVELLRSVYGDAFILIGVVCDEQVRIQRLTKNVQGAGQLDAKNLIQRDAEAPEKHGQRVSKAFHLADAFVDNHENEFTEGTNANTNPRWNIPEQLRRLVKIITHQEIVRPTSSETAMYHAFGAQMRSACLSRQVGAALMDTEGIILATGTNEVPKKGGGVYGEGLSPAHESPPESRCAYREDAYCSNTREQSRITTELVDTFISKGLLKEEQKEQATEVIRASRVGMLLEFSRAVHAEMDALLAAGRRGVSTIGSIAFVTTFPCHYCARHLVSAGVDEVQYIEPYPKSLALDLHDDAISKKRTKDGDKVVFRPFTGIAPRTYRRAFLKDRDLKDKKTGSMKTGQPAWGRHWRIDRVSYVQLEAELLRKETSDGA